MDGVRRLRFARLAFVATALGALAWSGAIRAGTGPAANRFLVATRQQHGFFAKTVILLIDYGQDGAFGLIVNRPTRVTLASLLPDVAALQGRPERLFVGGPVSPDHLIMLIRSGTRPPDAIHVMDDLYVSGSLKALRAITGGPPAGTSFRGYAGYAGWGPDQLDSEIARGAWVVVPATTDAVFSVHPERLWDRLIGRRNVDVVKSNALEPAAQGALGAALH